ncbi:MULTISPECIES: hypothetical protein [Aequorivita]|uniref:STAS/SEC14 domain-containing protein n=1 Tax=Aequorivita iocasae TaxID=2803865 RepID=A0ABX7DRL0_9FLAO|nr:MULTISPECIES: hypothetical protein [Aequorivita]QQX76241.1 hypothetical protein JK629_13035 [Aequorivita iocasae]UCA55704.1 hypothetical protein LDL78_13095 [Aequorivita sp. F7]
MIKRLFYEFGEINVFKNFVIAIMKEGITVKPEYNSYLEEIANTYFANKPFGYITYRKNSYAVDPMVYLKTSEIKNLVAFAVVAKDGQKISNTEIERIFFKKPFKDFTNLDDAKDWVNELIKGYE